MDTMVRTRPPRQSEPKAGPRAPARARLTRPPVEVRLEVPALGEAPECASGVKYHWEMTPDRGEGRGGGAGMGVGHEGEGRGTTWRV